MKKGGLTAEVVNAKLLEYNGNMAAVARHFGVTRQAVWDFVNRRETLKAVAVDVREGMKDNAESALYSAVLNGEAWAVCFFLKCQAKDRGYTERQELTGKDGGAIQQEHTGKDGGPITYDFDSLKKLPPDELIRIHRQALGPPDKSDR